MSYSTSSWTHVLCRGASVITMLLACLSAGAGDARPRFTYSDGGSQVTDAITGLTWRRCSLGQVWDEGTCKGSAKLFTHQNIHAIVRAYEGWRLPTPKELSSLREENRLMVQINQEAFPWTPRGSFLTWTPPADGSDSCPSYAAFRFDDPDSCAWFVHFDPEGPYIYISANAPSYVRLVRR